MPSRSLLVWRGARSSELDEVEAAHRGLGGARPGRRHATRQVNHAYAVLLAAQFQGFCRELYYESVEFLVATVPHPLFRGACRDNCTANLKLDRGNPNAGNIGSDFGRLGLAFWDEVKLLRARHQTYKDRLDELIRWRNAIAHQDFNSLPGQNSALQFRRVRSWRRACDGLAGAFDAVMRGHIQSVSGMSPW